MMQPRQGEVWMTDVGGGWGRRPALVLTRSKAVALLNHVTVAPLTRTPRRGPTVVKLERADGVPEVSYVMLDSIATIPKELLDRRIGEVRTTTLMQVFEAIREAFEMY